MPPRKKSQPKPADFEPNRLQRVAAGLLDVPLLGSAAFARLSRDLQSGDPRAATALARRLDVLASEPMQQAVADSLKGIGQSACVDAIWQEWLHSRSARLTEVLLAVHKPATAPSQTRAYSLLKLGRIKQLEDAPADLVMALILACDDPDEQLAGTARQVIGHLRQEDAFEILCAHWALTRNPFLEATILKAGYLAQNPVNVRVLTALKLNQPDQIPTGSPEVVAPLIAASRDADAEIAARAGYLLRHALSGAALTEFCLQWSRSREPDLEVILVESSLVPRQPPPLRLLCALKTGNPEIPRNCPPRSLEFLMNACQDADAVIQHNARSALRALQAQESREAVCQLFLSGGCLEARQIALDAGYLPAKEEDRALFLFLTEQWQAYETLDFDLRMLRAIYEAASPDLRLRIARTVQSAGRIEFLHILTGADERLRVGQMDAGEADLVVQMLAKNQNWSRLWMLAQNLTLRHSVEIVRLLATNQWSPAQPDEERLFRQLFEFAGQPLILSPEELAQKLPAAVPLATLKVHGRVNDIAFSPDQPLLALATGSRKVVLWDFQKGVVRQILTGFAHSVGQAAYLQDGRLVCAERTNGSETCEIIGVKDGQHFRIGQHAASVTALVPLSGGRLLTTGRDQKISLWDVTQRQKNAEFQADDWPRCAAVSPDGDFAALVTDRVRLLKLPNLEPLDGLPPISAKAPGTNRGMARCAAFSPDSADLLTGQLNGQVTHFSAISADHRRQKRLLHAHAGSVVGICFLPNRPFVITGGAEGELHFHAWPAGSLHSRILTPLPNLTSLEISPNGKFLATGFGQNAFTLWDLRTLDLPGVVDLPIARYQPDHLAAIESLAGADQLPADVRSTLGYLTALLQYRYRFDIQIAEINHIQPGEFDILLNDPDEDSGYNGEHEESNGSKQR